MVRLKRSAIAAVVPVVLLGASGVAVWTATTVRVNPGSAAGRLEAQVLDRTIEVLEIKYGDDPYLYLFGDRLVSLYTRRFQAKADLADLARAEEIAGRGASVSARPANAHARLAFVRLARHDFARAYGSARAAVEADSTDEAALAALFDAAEASGDYAVAAEALGRLPIGSTSRQLREARWLVSRGRLEDGHALMLGVCDRLERSPVPLQTVAWCQTLLADFAHQRSGPAEARRWLRRALETFPGYRGAVEGLANLAYAQARWARAEELYRSILSEAHPDLHLRLAEVNRSLGRDSTAARYEAEFTRIATAPQVEALFAHPLALHYAESAETRDRALEIALRDLKRRSTVESWEILAWVRMRRGESELALAASDEARALSAPSPGSDYVRARILEALGRAEESEALLRRALADPTLLEPHALTDLRARGS